MYSRTLRADKEAIQGYVRGSFRADQYDCSAEAVEYFTDGAIRVDTSRERLHVATMPTILMRNVARMLLYFMGASGSPPAF